MAEETHRRRGHVRHNANDTVSNVNEATVRNRGHAPTQRPSGDAPPRDALLALGSEPEEPPRASLEDDNYRQMLESFLGRSHEAIYSVVDGKGLERPLTDQEMSALATLRDLLNRLDLGRTDNGDADDVVFALEYPEWSSRGFNREQHRPWLGLGFEPEKAAEWRDAGFSVEEALPWLGAYAVHGPISVQDAAIYRDAGIDVGTGIEWTTTRRIPADDAMRWMADGVKSADAMLWRQLTEGDYDTHRDWVALGVTDPSDAGVLHRIGHDGIDAWRKAGVDLEDIPNMNKWEPFREYGYDEADMVAFEQSEYGKVMLLDWAKERIPGAQIIEFVEKGYTPKQAARHLAKGETSATVDDRRNGEPVPGKAWQAIRDAIDHKNRDDKYEVDISEERKPDGSIHVRVLMYRAGDRAGYPEEAYALRFFNTGRFASGGADYKSSNATVSGFLEDYFPNAAKV